MGRRKKEDIEELTPKRSKARFVLLFFVILTTITTAVCLVDLYLLLEIRSFQKYIYVAMGVLVLLQLIFIFKTRKRFRKRAKKTYKNKAILTFVILYFLITLTFGGAVSYVYLYLGSFNKSIVTYSSSLVVKADNEAEKIRDIKNYTIGILKDKKSPEGYIIPKEVIHENHLENDNTIKKYDNYSSMVADLYSGDIDAIFINSDYASTYSSISGYEDIMHDTKVILKKEKKMVKRDGSSVSKSRGKKITEPFTILLMGVDSVDEGLSKNTVANGDSIILITFNPKTLNATMLSIPRDSYVPIACWSDKAENKITHAAAYGTDCMMQTIEEYFDVNIDYYAKINFKGLVHLVDAVGGIDVEVPKDLCTDDSNRTKIVCINEGQQHLDGEGALVLARNRKQLAGGDLDRGQNQQLVIKALINKIKNIKSASQLMKILNTVSNNIDTNFTSSQILSFYNVAEDIMSNNLAKDESDLVNIQQLYLQGTGEMIYDKNMRMELWDYVPNSESRKDIIKAMKMNLGLLKHKTIKKFSFSINEEYEKKVIGYGPYKNTTSSKSSSNSSTNSGTVPNFIGLTKAQAQALANKYGVRISFNGYVGTVTYQSIASGRKIDSSSTVVLTIRDTSVNNNSTSSSDNSSSNNTTTDSNDLNVVIGDDDTSSSSSDNSGDSGSVPDGSTGDGSSGSGGSSDDGSGDPDE